MLARFSPEFWYAFLQLGVIVTFAITALRAWKHSRARFVELVSAFLFGLLLEQGDIFLFGTYRYNENWILLGDVPIAIALTWALIIAGAMNMTDALGIPTNDGGRMTNRMPSFVSAPMADAVWAILLDLAIDAIAIRLGLWTWTIRADEGWFGVPWGNFFAWLFVAFWFSFFTRLVRGSVMARSGLRDKAISNVRGIQTAAEHGSEQKRLAMMLSRQWFVPFFAFLALIATLVPFVAIENTAALPFVPDDAPAYNNAVWVIFAFTLAVFVSVTVWALRQTRSPREPIEHWLLLVRLVIHLLFLCALLVTGMYFDAPLLLVVAVAMLLVEIILTRGWFIDLGITARRCLRQNFVGARVK